MKTHVREKKRIAVGALLFEGNSLSVRRDGLDVFRNNYFFKDAAVLDHLRGGSVEVSGAICVLDTLGHESVPLIATHGAAGGLVTTHAWNSLKTDVLARLRLQGDLDGIYLALHGAMLCEGVDDPEGELLEAIRGEFGAIPMAVSCDLHGHITEKMFQAADILVGYQLYPHDDTFETGQRAAGLLCRIVDDGIQFHSALCKAPMILPSQRQRTAGDTPMADLYRTARFRSCRAGLFGELFCRSAMDECRRSGICCGGDKRSW